MNYFFKIMILFVFIFNLTIKIYGEETTNNSYLDENNVKYKDLLFILEKKYKQYYNKTEEFREFYLLGLEHHNTGNYEEAIDNYIQACKTLTIQIAYYQLGLCLMEIEAYENAVIAFEKSFDFVYTYKEEVKDLYTYDNNGQTRETYFAYYNIGCIYALQGKTFTGTQYICEAILHGYPYLDHIKNDPDVKKIVKNNSYWEKIRKTYNAGFKNTVAGKGFEYAWAGAPGGYYFTKENIVYRFEGGVGIDEGTLLYGEYEVKNNLIIIKNIHWYSTKKCEQYFEYIKRFDASEYQKYGGTLQYEEVPVENYKEVFKHVFSDRDYIPQAKSESVNIDEIEMPDTEMAENKENAVIQNNSNDKKLNPYIWIIAAFLGVGIILSIFIMRKKRK